MWRGLGWAGLGFSAFNLQGLHMLRVIGEICSGPCKNQLLFVKGIFFANVYTLHE
jgi:hypothetical protein